MGKDERLAVLKQDHFAYEEETCIRCCYQGT